MNKGSYIEATDRTNLTYQTKFRLSEISKIENYFILSFYYFKKLSKYVTVFDYIGKILIVLSGTSGGVSIIFFTTVIGAPAGIASASFTLIFSLTTGMIRQLLPTLRNKMKKDDKFLVLPKNKLNKH